MLEFFERLRNSMTLSLTRTLSLTHTHLLSLSLILPTCLMQHSMCEATPVSSNRKSYKWSLRGIVVMGGDSSSEGFGFESRYRILDRHFSQIFVVKIVMMFV